MTQHRFEPFVYLDQRPSNTMPDGAALPRAPGFRQDYAAPRHCELRPLEGHRAGVERVREVVETAGDLGIKVLTLYTFSKENWKRPAAEVGLLMKMLERHLRAEEETLVKNNIRFSPIGNITDLPKSVQKVVAERGLTEDDVEKRSSETAMISIS